MAPLISVIMPVYNQEKYLAETIESVLGQTYKDFEFVIMDDGSKDNSVNIIRHYAKIDNRIVAMYSHNSGRAATTNKIVALARGKWCAFLDADDVMIFNRLEKQIAFHIKNLDVDASSCHCTYINSEGTFQGIQRFPFVKNVEEARTAKDKIINCAITGFMITKDAFVSIGGLNTQFWPCDDLEFFNRLADNNYILVIIQEILMKYRIHSSATSVSNKWHMYQMICYTHYCIKLRRANIPEISFEDYKSIKNNEAWWDRLNGKIYHYGLLFHKEASFAYHSKNYVSFLLLMAAASLLSPKFVYAATLNRVKNVA